MQQNKASVKSAGKFGTGAIITCCAGLDVCALGAVSYLGYLFISPGLDRPASKSRIADYVSYNCAISGFTVSERPQEQDSDDKHEKGHKDYLWTVTEKDGTQFTVKDYYCYTNAAFRAPRRQTDNYNSVRAQKYLQQVDCRGFTLRGDVNEFYNGIWLESGFSARRELRGLVDRLNALAADCPRGTAVPYWLKFKHTLRSPRYADKFDFGDTEARDRDSWLKAGEKLSYEKCERNMLEVLIDMRYEPSLRDFTDAEIHACVQGNNLSFGVKQNDGSYKVYDDLLLGRCSDILYLPVGYHEGLSVPTAYEVMKRSGYKVSETPHHYSFQGVDGHNYEFAVSYLETLPCCYLKDGQRVPLDEDAVRRGYYCSHISLNLFRKMTGIECVYYSMVKRENG